MPAQDLIDMALALVPAEALETVNLDIPAEYALELAAAQMVEHLAEYHKVLRAQRAARHNEDHQRAEQFSKILVYTRNVIALTQHEYPQAKAIADEIMRNSARATTRNREAAKEHV